VVVQTFVPNHYAIRPVRDHDYESFYVEELSHRAELGFPPFGRLAYVLVSSPELEVAMAAAQALALALDAAGAIGPRCARMGPAPAPLARLRGRHRVQLLLRGEAEPVRRAAGILAAAIPGLEGDVQAVLDVNPVHML
jgi:primosomal protein N' (replication factor Y)